MSKPKSHYVFAFRDRSKVVDPPDYELVACLFLCSVIRICMRERFWSGIVDNLDRIAIRCKVFFVIFAHCQRLYINTRQIPIVICSHLL